MSGFNFTTLVKKTVKVELSNGNSSSGNVRQVLDDFIILDHVTAIPDTFKIDNIQKMMIHKAHIVSIWIY